MEFLQSIWLFIKSNRKYIGVSLLSALLFAILLFPLSDVSDLVANQIAKATQNQVILQFRGLSFSVAPPGLGFDSVSLEARGLPMLPIQQLVLSPSIMSLLTNSPAGSAKAKGIFQGNISASIGSGSKSEAGVPRQKLELNAENLQLQDLLGFVHVPMTVKGQLDLKTAGLMDLSFQEQPEIELSASGRKIEIPPGSLETPMGPLALPEVRLSTLSLKSKLSSGKLQIEEVKLGGDGDELRGNIKGTVNVQMQNMGGAVPAPFLGAYSLDVDLTVAKSAGTKYSFFLSLLDRFKTESATGAQYRFRVSAASLQSVPSLDAAR